jgi:hypothetical protein
LLNSLDNQLLKVEKVEILKISNTTRGSDGHWTYTWMMGIDRQRRQLEANNETYSYNYL